LPRSPLFPYTTLFRSSMRSRCSRDLEWPCPNREDYRPDDPQPSATGVERPVGEMPVSHHIPASRMAYLLDRSVPPGKIVDLGGADRKSTRLNSSHVAI